MSDQPVVYRTAVTRYLTPQAFAQHFGVSYMTVLRLVTAGDITGHRIGRSIRIPQSEVARFRDATRMEKGA